MREAGIRAKTVNKWRAMTLSHHGCLWWRVRSFANSRLRLNCMWATEGWLYLTVALALYSRFAISWAMGFRLTVDSPEQVLTMALPTRPQGPGSCTIRIAAANTPLRVTSICRSVLGYDFPSEFEARTAERNPMSTKSRRGHFAQ